MYSLKKEHYSGCVYIAASEIVYKTEPSFQDLFTSLLAEIPKYATSVIDTEIRRAPNSLNSKHIHVML